MNRTRRTTIVMGCLLVSLLAGCEHAQWDTEHTFSPDGQTVAACWHESDSAVPLLFNPFLILTTNHQSIVWADLDDPDNVQHHPVSSATTWSNTAVNDPLLTILFSEDSRYLLAQTRQRVIRIDRETGDDEMLLTLRNLDDVDLKTEYFQNIELASDPQYLLVRSTKRLVRYDREARTFDVLTPKADVLTSVATTPTGDIYTITHTQSDGVVRRHVWTQRLLDAPDQRELLYDGPGWGGQFEPDDARAVAKALATYGEEWSPDRRYLIFGEDATLMLLDTTTRKTMLLSDRVWRHFESWWNADSSLALCVGHAPKALIKDETVEPTHRYVAWVDAEATACLDLTRRFNELGDRARRGGGSQIVRGPIISLPDALPDTHYVELARIYADTWEYVIVLDTDDMTLTLEESPAPEDDDEPAKVATVYTPDGSTKVRFVSKDKLRVTPVAEASD